MKQMSPDAFKQTLEQGEFAMNWEAHGHCYGLRRAIDDDIRAGRTVVVNVSRTIIGKMRRIYADVVVVSITAPSDVLAARLAMRARGSDGRIEQRLAPHGRRRFGAGRHHRQCQQRRISRAPASPCHQGRQMGRIGGPETGGFE